MRANTVPRTKRFIVSRRASIYLQVWSHPPRSRGVELVLGFEFNHTPGCDVFVPSGQRIPEPLALHRCDSSRTCMRRKASATTSASLHVSGQGPPSAAPAQRIIRWTATDGTRRVIQLLVNLGPRWIPRNRNSSTTASTTATIAAVTADGHGERCSPGHAPARQVSPNPLAFGARAGTMMAASATAFAAVLALTTVRALAQSVIGPCLFQPAHVAVGADQAAPDAAVVVVPRDALTADVTVTAAASGKLTRATISATAGAVTRRAMVAVVPRHGGRRYTEPSYCLRPHRPEA